MLEDFFAFFWRQQQLAADQISITRLILVFAPLSTVM